MGWEMSGGFPEGTKKCVLIAGLHTSNWDFLYGKLAMILLNIKVKYFIKKELFVFPLNYFFKWSGGIPVDRGKSNNLIDEMAEIIKASDEFVLIITPEGTRSYQPEWKKGFYFISEKAEVPIIMGYLDYKKKKIRFGDVLEKTGDVYKDMETIKNYYRKTTPKFPEKGLDRYELED